MELPAQICYKTSLDDSLPHFRLWVFIIFAWACEQVISWVGSGFKGLMRFFRDLNFIFHLFVGNMHLDFSSSARLIACSISFLHFQDQ